MKVYAVLDDQLSPDFPLGDALEVFIRQEDPERSIAEVRGATSLRSQRHCGSRSAKSGWRTDLVEHGEPQRDETSGQFVPGVLGESVQTSFARDARAAEAHSERGIRTFRRRESGA